MKRPRPLMLHTAMALAAMLAALNSHGETAASAAVSPPVYLESAVKNLCGTVEIRQAFGPPNFGETPATDARVRVVSINLRQALQVAGSKDPALPAVQGEVLKQVQLLAPGAVLKGLRRHQSVCASGFLTQGISGHHFEKAVLDVNGGKVAVMPRPRHGPHAADAVH